MKKQNVLNLLMVISIILMVMSGIMAVRSLKGTPATTNIDEINTEQELSKAIFVQDTVGIVTVERNGISYEVDEYTEVRSGDIFHTKASAAAILAENENAVISLGENTKLTVTEMSPITFVHEQGEVFADIRDGENDVRFIAEETEIISSKAVFTVCTQAAASTIYVYSDEVEVYSDGATTPTNVKAGQMISIVENNSSEKEVAISEFTASDLSDDQILLLENCTLDNSFCLTEADLLEVKNTRAAEKEEAQQAALLAEEVAKEELEKEWETYENAQTEIKPAEVEDVLIKPPKYCTIEIRCDTILNNMENLSTGKEGYVPENGVILAVSQVSFEEGETVFDILQRTCSITGIQLEYAWTPLYNSYYIEGINNLYEFDCGSQSGWMYKVNGWFPNYGCSSYIVQEGDNIVWCYTCNGLGEDVGK